jgi:membrane protease YdiL (CAAX protease family)
MNVFKAWIRKRPVIAFYIVCFVISWGLWLPLLLSHNDLAELIALVGVFGPALACVLITRMSDSSSGESHPIPFWLSFAAGWIGSTLIFLFYNGLPAARSSPIVVVIFAILALVPAYIIASAASGPSGVRSALSTLIRPRGWWGWYAVALALPLVSRLASVWLSRVIGWSLLSSPQVPSNLLDVAGSVLIVFLYTFVYAGGIDEETGWTGLALPRMLDKISPLVATIIVWALWMLWHLPMHLSGYFDLTIHTLIGSFLGRFLMTWLFIRSSGGVLTALLLHTSVNVTSQFVPLTNASLLVDGLIALLVIVGARMWERMPAVKSGASAENRLSV